MLEIKLALEDIFRVFIDPLQINNVSLTSTLDDLLEISIEGPPRSSLSADSAIDLWWSDCRTTRRTNQIERKPY